MNFKHWDILSCYFSITECFGRGLGFEMQTCFGSQIIYEQSLADMGRELCSRVASSSGLVHSFVFFVGGIWFFILHLLQGKLNGIKNLATIACSFDIWVLTFVM